MRSDGDTSANAKAQNEKQNSFRSQCRANTELGCNLITHVVHLFLQALAERTPSDGSLLLRLGEGNLADAVAHAVLLHHGVGHARHLAQVILSSCGVTARGRVSLEMFSEQVCQHSD